LWFFIEAKRIMIIQNNKERQAVRQHPQCKDLGSFPVVCLVFMVVEWQWDSFVSVFQLPVASITLPMNHSHSPICLSTSVTCCQYHSTNVPQSFTYLSQYFSYLLPVSLYQ